MEIGFAAFAFLIGLVFYIFIFWLVIRAIRALEKIADNLWAISRTNTRSVEAIEKIADRIERIAGNENTREQGQDNLCNRQLRCQEVKNNMDFIGAFFPLLLIALLYILSFWLLLRAVRAIERIAAKIAKIVDNENTREQEQIDLFNLIAGKGPKRYPEFNSVRSDFDDREIAADFLDQLKQH